MSTSSPKVESSPVFTPSTSREDTPQLEPVAEAATTGMAVESDNLTPSTPMVGADQAPATSATHSEATNSKLEADSSTAADSTKAEVNKSTSADSNKTPSKNTAAVCKKHPATAKDASLRKCVTQRKKRTSMKAVEISSSSDSSSTSDSSSSSEESDDDKDTRHANPAGSSDDSDADDTASSSSDSDEASHRRQRRNQKAKAKARSKNRSRGKRKSHHRSSSSSESDSSDEETSSLDEKECKKILAKVNAKLKANKKLRSKETTSEDREENASEGSSDEHGILWAKEKLAALQLKLGDGRRTKSRKSKEQRHTNTDGRRESRKGHSQHSKDNNNNNKKKKKKRKQASKVAFKRVDQLWDNSIHNYRLRETVDDPDADEWDQYIFTVRRRFDWENKYIETVVDIKSKHLRDALLQVMDGVKGVSLVQETAAVDPNMLFLYLEEIRKYMKDLKQLAKTEKKKKMRKAAALKASHLKVLIKYLDEDYAETKKTLYPLLKANMITFDLLWALFKPDTIVYTSTYGNQDEPRAFKIEYATKESSFMRGQWYSIEGRYLEYDGKSFGMGTMAADVDSFKGARKITSLACYPLKYHREAEEVKAKLIERGKKFVALRGMNYRFHMGMAFYKKRRSVVKVNINGRIMIDPAIHRRINPNYQISTVRPKDPDMLDSENEDNDDSQCCCDMSESESENNFAYHRRESDVPKVKYKVVRDREGQIHVVEVELDEEGNEIRKESLEAVGSQADGLCDPEFSEEELLIASPVILGFAFSEKLWLEFSVSGISDVNWNEDAFEALVLPDNQKSIVKALVESHTFNAAQNIDDVIQGKGKGLVAVLHGPPGTGKTLTAEGIAELLKRPLYMVSAGELGTDPRTLEGELNKILDIAHSWGAVLLLDEADIFLEKRTIQDIHRNALVSIFLRLLEYFQGILFLTTNRVETFDDAFQSRIHVALRYGELTAKAKRSVWKMFLDKVQAMDGVRTAKFTDKDFDALVRHDLNGRQIKNSVRTAQALAVNEKTPLSMEHIKRVLEVAETFDKDLRGGTGYLDAMRSYT